MLKAIETRYKGYRFRSRLEARWAVFFDALGVQWEYEKEGYDLGEAGWYLPDFWLPEQKYWFEVKGETPTDEEIKKALALGYFSQQHVFIAGNPELLPIKVYDYESVTLSGDMRGTIRWFWPRNNLQDNEHFTGMQWLENKSIGFRIGAFTGDCIEDLYGNLGHSEYDPYSPRIKAAYAAARAARFEHGEQP